MKKYQLANYLKRYDDNRDFAIKLFGSSKEISQLKRILHKSELRQLKDHDELPEKIINEIIAVIKNSTTTSGLTYQILAEIKSCVENGPASSESNRKHRKTSLFSETKINFSNDNAEGIQTQNKKIAFLIEGFKTSNDSRFPDVVAGVQIAKENACEIFDTISSYDVTHLAEAIKGADERKQKVIVLSIFLTFSRAGTPQAIIDKIIKPPFQHLVETGLFKEMPRWLTNLNFLTINTFAQNVLDTYFKGNHELFADESKKIKDELTTLSNQISQNQLIQYVVKNPDITTVYGLIGSIHLVMLDSIGKVISKEDNHYYVQINVNDRIIDIHLFGGTHGETAHYEKMAEFVSKQGLSVPKFEPPKVEIDIKLLLSVLASQSKQTYMSESSFEDNRNRSELRTRQSHEIKPQAIEELAERFDYWMKNYNHFGNKTHNQELLNWLTADMGAEYIQNYKQFCDLASGISKKGYKTSTPPSESEFNHAMSEYEERAQYDMR